MTKSLHYGTTAKVFHWAIVALLVVQYSIGWLMPDVHGGPPGVPMTWHISIGTVILGLIAARFLWRLTHPVAPESSLPPMATNHVRSGALAPLCPGATDDLERLAVRLRSRLERVMVLPGAAAHANVWQPRTCQGARRLAPELHVGFVDRCGTAHRCCFRASVLLSRPRYAADTAR